MLHLRKDQLSKIMSLAFKRLVRNIFKCGVIILIYLLSLMCLYTAKE